MSYLRFIGIGSAFNTQLGNTSACIKKSNSLILIDCGATVFCMHLDHKITNKEIEDNGFNVAEIYK